MRRIGFVGTPVSEAFSVLFNPGVCFSNISHKCGECDTYIYTSRKSEEAKKELA